MIQLELAITGRDLTEAPTMATVIDGYPRTSLKQSKASGIAVFQKSQKLSCSVLVREAGS